MAPRAVSKATNLWVSRLIPLLLVGIVGYVTWVVVVLIGVKYLLKPPHSLQQPRHGAAMAILILYSILFLLMTWTYFRLLYVVTFNPGYVPCSPEWYAERNKTQPRGTASRRRSRAAEDQVGEKANADSLERSEINSNRHSEQSVVQGVPAAKIPKGDPEAEESFFNKEVYVCKGDGMPIWCSSCLIWKPDRARHCREVDRCVRKMDHFCPWVGGVVSETSFNFFIQFTGWATVFCFFNLIHLSVFIAEYRQMTGNINVHWIVSLALAGMFGLFTLGMTGSSLRFVLVNTTTIENLSRQSIVWDLAVRVPDSAMGSVTAPTVSISSTTTPSQQAIVDGGTTIPLKKYAILHSRPGDNIWDLGTFRNFQSVMGYTLWEWIFPLRHSPCCDHSGKESQFEMGPVVDEMRKQAGLLDGWSSNEKAHRQEKRRRRKRRFHNVNFHSKDQLSEVDAPDEGDPQWVRDVEQIV